MRKLVVTQFMSLDGVIENPGWTFPYWNDEIARFKGAETSAGEDMLLGRVTYQGFAAAWPNSKDQGAPYFNGARKYVVSNTLKTLEWNNSVLINGDVVEEIRKLKQQDGPTIVVHGSANLIQTLIKNDLVDTYRLLIYPLVLGKGERLFQDGSPINLKLIESRDVGKGVVSFIYEPDRQS